MPANKKLRCNFTGRRYTCKLSLMVKWTGG